MQHVIKKQVIDLILDKSLDSFHIQELMSRQYWNDVIPLLEQLFDGVAPGDEVMEIDRLEIDLGVFSEKHIEKESWTEGLKDKLEKLLAGYSVPHASIRSNIRSSRLNVFSQWMYYMQRGHLPWNTIAVDDAWYLEVLEALAAEFESVQALRFNIRTDVYFLQRLVSQQNNSFLKALVEILTSQKQVDLLALLDELTTVSEFLFQQQSPTPAEPPITLKRKLWMRVLRIASDEANTKEGKMHEYLVRSVVNEFGLMETLPVNISSKLSVAIPLIEGFVEEKKKREHEIQKTISRKRNEINYLKTQKKKTPHQAEKRIKGEEKEVTQKREEEFIPGANYIDERAARKEFNRNLSEAIGKEGIPVMHAGLVLVHPFLKTAFTRLNFLLDKKFVDLEKHQKAIYLLHYLATGKKEAEEFELVIPKVLCGFPLEEPIETSIELSDAEIEEGDQMLDAVLAQWEILKNTSGEGLREGFLQRGGKLSSKDDKLYLHVERNSIDILLNYLPWNLSLIMLPWTNEILRVEWA